jgi:pseudouridine synthase
VRLNKFLAQYGGISRRHADRFIREGRVRINGRVLRELGLRVDPEIDKIHLDGKRVSVKGDQLYLLLNKPSGYLVTSRDPQKRSTVFQLLGKMKDRVFPVGRLDQDTEGVLLFTNDGELAHRLAHPQHGMVKGYRALVSGRVDEQELDRFLKGIRLEDGLARARSVKLLARGFHTSEVYLEIITGKKRQVKRMCAAIGHPVMRLRRTTFAGLSAEGLDPGQWRYLTRAEIQRLKSANG